MRCWAGRQVRVQWQGRSGCAERVHSAVACGARGSDWVLEGQKWEAGCVITLRRATRADSTAGMHCNKRCLALGLCVCRESPDPYIINSRGNCLNSLGRWSGAAGGAEQDQVQVVTKK